MNRTLVRELPDRRLVSRRPIAEVFRRTARWATNLCVRWGISADAISYLSVIAATAAAFCFWRSARDPWLLFVAPFFCFLRLWCNMLDGMVALAAGSASARGEILNDLPDRISDVIIFTGAAHSGWMHPLIGYWAAIFSLGTAYIGMLGQAVGARREFGGLMSKPWRMVALTIGAWVSFLLWNLHRQGRFFGLTTLDLACLVVVGGCWQTSLHRLRRIFHELRKPNE